MLVGHGDHEEVVGTLGEAPGHMTLVERPEDVGTALEFAPDAPVAYLTQTTLATDETADDRRPLSGSASRGLVGPSADDICYATQNRQDAVRAMAGPCDLLLVVGSANSSNTARLVEVARRRGLPGRAGRGRRRTAAGPGSTAPPPSASRPGPRPPSRWSRRWSTPYRELGPVSVTEVRTTDETARFTLPTQVR